MQTFKQGIAAVALIVSLGLVVPGLLVGSARAGLENSGGHNPQRVDTTFNCDLNGDGSYETSYELVSTFSSTMWQDKNSNKVIVQRLRVDVIDSYYVDPTGVAAPVLDPDVYWFDGPQSYDQGGGKPKGWKTVRCTEIVSYLYTATADDVALGLGFIEGVEYLETDTNLYDVTVSPAGGGNAKAAKAEGKHKRGAHKGKKRGR